MKKFIFLTLLACAAAGCGANQSNLYVQDKDYLQRRVLETRTFDTANDRELLIASAQVLQDMGYTIKESEANLGLITAEKNREAGSTAGKVALTVLAVIGGTTPQYEDKQRFYVNIVTSKIEDGKAVKTRVLFTRRTWDNYGNLMKVEKISDAKLYQEFFDKLSQSVFLTAHGI